MKSYGLYESAAVKVQILKTAIEVCILYQVNPSGYRKADYSLAVGCMHALTH